MLPDENWRGWRVAPVVVFAAYVAVRLAVFAASDNGIDFHHNAYDRGLFVERWLANFEVVPDAAYGPVGYYLTAATMALVPDPILAPRLLSLISSLALFWIVAVLARRIFGVREAVLALVLLSVHPHGIRLSVVGLDMMPYAALVMAAFLAWDRWWTNPERVGLAALAGFAFTIAAATRFEIWAVLPMVAGLALLRARRAGLAFVAASAVFPVAWCVWQWRQTGDPLNFLGISQGVSAIHMAGLSLFERAIAWPAVLAHDAPLPTALLALAAFITLRRTRRAWALMASAAWTFAVFETQTLRGAMGTNETKYVMPLVVMLIPQAAAELVRRLNGRRFEKFIASGMSVILIGLSTIVTLADNTRFAVPGGAVEQAAFLRETPRRPERVVIGTSLQGWLLVHADLADGRAVLAAPGPGGAFDEDDLRKLLDEPCVRYLAYEPDNPVDFAPVLELPDETKAERLGFTFTRVFRSGDGRFAVYRVERPDSADCLGP
ncbi:MAG: glycosyltransferase family 39 protein [Deltaproteobacteria bacterium]|nr:glycosyltransferase family 39 protein [Deltaproteobacteria bacterium]